MDTFLPFSKPAIDEATIASVADVLRSGWITSGPKVAEFEKQLSAYFGGRPVRTFNSGTCTMEIALRIAGIKNFRHSGAGRNPAVFIKRAFRVLTCVVKIFYI